MVCLIKNNGATNKAFADQLQTSVAGCYSHQCSLAAGDSLGNYDHVVERLYRIMFKLQNLISASKIRRHTNLRPIPSMKTKWSFTFQMLRRYIVHQQFLE